MSTGGQKIIIVKRKKKGHAAHHGGSWKVAYADFVTAMMAFFLVMWIMSMDEGVKDMVQGYFQNPVGFKQTYSGGANPMSAGNFITNLDVKRTVILNRRNQEEGFQRAVNEIEAHLASDSVVKGLSAEVDVVIDEEGLRIELMEADQEATFFEKASSQLKPALQEILAMVGSTLADIPGDVVVEGHTDRLPFGRRGYSNWELSVDRANAARRELERGGLSPDRVTEVRGYADRKLKVEERPLDPHNRRISILLPFVITDLDLLKIPGLDPEVITRAALDRKNGA